ncbi:MAG: sugar ABC transporter permease [Clostridia bacterium]|nr:sugar ABC transporter permease [Clostridia bacterium]
MSIGIKHNSSKGSVGVLSSSLPCKIKRRKNSKRMLRTSLQCWVFLIPVSVGMVVFAATPILMSLFFSFTNYNGAFISQIGAFNFKRLFDFSSVAGERFLNSMRVTFIYVIANMAFCTVLSYALALFLHRKMKGIGVVRLLFYLPCLIPGFISGFIYMAIFRYSASGSTGLINTWLLNLGLPQLTFFSAKSTAIPTLVFTNVFGLGGGMIMLLAAFSNIPPTLYEAARLDGAGYFKQLFHITIPLSTPIVFYNLVTSLIAGLQTFGTYAAYGTGPEEEFNFMAVEIYRMAFSYHNYGLACAEAYLLFVIVGLLSIIMFKFSGWVHYGDD